MKTIQQYNNPFKRALEVHYSVPSDPDFCFSNLTVRYQDIVVEGVIKEKEAVKAEFKEAQDKGETVMMANLVKTEGSVLKVRIGNIEPK